MEIPRLFKDISLVEETNFKRLALAAYHVEKELYRQIYLLAYPLMYGRLQSIMPYQNMIRDTLDLSQFKVSPNMGFKNWDIFHHIHYLSSLINDDRPEYYQLVSVCDFTMNLYSCIQVLRPVLLDKWLRHNVGDVPKGTPDTSSQFHIFEEFYFNPENHELKLYAQKAYHSNHLYRIYAKHLTNEGWRVPNIITTDADWLCQRQVKCLPVWILRQNTCMLK